MLGVGVGVGLGIYRGQYSGLYIIIIYGYTVPAVYNSLASYNRAEQS